MTRTFQHEADGLLRIETADGRSIHTTEEHPFWVEGRGFVAAKRLGRSDLLRDADGDRVRVERVTWLPGRVAVYNFEVEGTHTYNAGGYWVHNTCPDPYAGQPFPGMSPRQGLHSPLKGTDKRFDNFPAQAPGKTPLDPAELPPGVGVEDALRDGWNNPEPGGALNPETGEFFGIPGYPLNAAGDTRLQMRVGSKGVHGWPSR